VPIGVDDAEQSGTNWFITEDCHGAVVIKGSPKRGWSNVARLPWAIGEGKLGYSFLGALDGSDFYFLLLNNATRNLALWRALPDGRLLEVRKLQMDGLVGADMGWSLVVQAGRWWAFWNASPSKGARANIREAHTLDGGDGVARTFISNQSALNATYADAQILRVEGLPTRIVLSRTWTSGPGLVTKRWDAGAKRWSGVSGVPYTAAGGTASTYAEAGYRLGRLWITSEVCRTGPEDCYLYLQAYGSNGWKVSRLKGWLRLAKGPSAILGVMEDYVNGPQPQLTLMFPMDDDAPREGVKLQTIASNPVLILGDDYDTGNTLYLGDSPDGSATNVMWQ
jgi:hypothetical protein